MLLPTAGSGVWDVEATSHSEGCDAPIPASHHRVPRRRPCAKATCASPRRTASFLGQFTHDTVLAGPMLPRDGRKPSRACSGTSNFINYAIDLHCDVSNPALRLRRRDSQSSPAEVRGGGERWRPPAYGATDHAVRGPRSSPRNRADGSLRVLGRPDAHLEGVGKVGVNLHGRAEGDRVPVRAREAQDPEQVHRRQTAAMKIPRRVDVWTEIDAEMQFMFGTGARQGTPKLRRQSLPAFVHNRLVTKRRAASAARAGNAAQR